jgi:hypothetical protein
LDKKLFWYVFWSFSLIWCTSYHYYITHAIWYQPMYTCINTF